MSRSAGEAFVTWAVAVAPADVPIDQISLGDVHAGVEEAGDDADLPRIPRGSTTVEDQRPPALSAALVRAVDLGLILRGPWPAVGAGGRRKRSRKRCCTQGSRLSQDACWALPGADYLSRSIPDR